MRLVAIAALGLLLAACAQNYGGITKVDASFTPEGLPTVEYVSGKESAGIKFDFAKSANGDIRIRTEAQGTAAFEGQAIQADRITEQFRIFQDTLPDIIRGVLCSMGIGTTC